MYGDLPTFVSPDCNTESMVRGTKTGLSCCETGFSGSRGPEVSEVCLDEREGGRERAEDLDREVDGDGSASFGPGCFKSCESEGTGRRP